MNRIVYEIEKGSPCIIWYEENNHPFVGHQESYTTKDHTFELWEDHVMNTDKFYIFKKNQDGITWFIRLDNVYVKRLDVDSFIAPIIYAPVVPVEHINITLQIAKNT